MRGKNKLRCAVYSFLLTLMGCATVPSPGWYELPSPNEMEHKTYQSFLLSADMVRYVHFWETETGARYDDFTLVFAHGLNFGDTWYAVINLPGRHQLIEVERLVTEIRKDNPGIGRIVLIVCNESGLTLDAPGVTYAKDSVWLKPDSFTSTANNKARDAMSPNIGSIREFVENP